MKVFHNPAEMATMTDVWYQGRQYYIPIIIDHTAAEERQSGSRRSEDNAEGLHRASCLVYISEHDLGFVPRKDRTFEISEAGAVNEYYITKADCEDGEIILELEMVDE